MTSLDDGRIAVLLKGPKRSSRARGEHVAGENREARSATSQDLRPDPSVRSGVTPGTTAIAPLSGTRGEAW